jgi:hypothetical protein
VSFYEGLKPTAEMIKTVQVTQKKQAEIQKLVKRGEKQRELVNSLSATIEDMVLNQPWKKCFKPEDIKDCKRKLSDTKEEFLEETEMLEAIQLALTNTRKDAQAVISGPHRVVAKAFKNAAHKAEEEVCANLDKAMDDFFLLKHATGSGFSGACYELEIKGQNPSHFAELSNRFGRMVEDLRERTQLAAK